MDASDLYDTDFVLWTEQPAAALRHLIMIESQWMGAIRIVAADDYVEQVNALLKASQLNRL